MDLINLIRLTHGSELNQAMNDIENSEPQDSTEFIEICEIATSALISALLVDDTFNEYSEKEIAAAVNEAICEYVPKP